MRTQRLADTSDAAADFKHDVVGPGADRVREDAKRVPCGRVQTWFVNIASDSQGRDIRVLRLTVPDVLVRRPRGKRNGRALPAFPELLRKRRYVWIDDAHRKQAEKTTTDEHGWPRIPGGRERLPLAAFMRVFEVWLQRTCFGAASRGSPSRAASCRRTPKFA